MSGKLQLDDLRIVWQNENFIDNSCNEMVTPKVQEENRWVTTRSGSRLTVQVIPVVIPLKVYHFG